MSEKKVHFTTPVGEARWAHLVKPRAFQEGGKDQGAPKFSIEVYFKPDAPEWKEFLAKLKNGVGNKKLPIKWETDEADQKTGLAYASFKTGEKFRPHMFDRYGKKMEENILLGNGSKVRVNFGPNEYTGFGGGVNFYLNAVQVVDLIEYQSKDAKGYGFEAEPMPAGFVPQDAPPAEDDSLPF